MKTKNSGLTVEQLAQAKGLTVKFLNSVGVVDGIAGNRSKKNPCVEIPYLDQIGKVNAVRKRYALEGKRRFAWRQGDHPTLYGLNRIKAIRHKGWVILVEGESDCWVLWFKKLPTLGIPGTSTWKNEFVSLLDGLTVYLWHEPDAGGDALMKAVSAELPALRVIEAPSGVKDPSDLYLQNPAKFEQTMDKIIKGACLVSKVNNSDLPEIVISKKYMREIAGESWEALLKANDPPVLFQRGHTIVELLFNEEGTPFISTLDRAALRGRLDRAANFDSLADNDKVKPARPPGDVVADMMVAPELPLPILGGITEAPIFTTPNVLVSTPGYHQESHFYLHLDKGPAIPSVADCPDASCLAQARSLLLNDLLADFPFADDADLAHAIAALLLPFVRPLIEGPTPLHMIESPTPGSGKGLLADVLTIPAAGRVSAVMTEGRDEDEWRKRLTAKLLVAPQFILIDNIRSRLDSANLSAALTSEVWEDRRLGHSQMVAIPVACVWLATANNPTLSLEIARRSVSIKLDTMVERPWERTGFKHANLRRWAKEHRGELIWAALTMVRVWIAAGRPNGQLILGSYESWSDVIGGILDTVRIPGFLANSNRVYKETEQEGSSWEEFLTAWWQEYQATSITASILFDIARKRRLLLEVWAGRDEHAARTRFGQALRRMRDRVIGGYHLKSVGKDTHSKAQLYQLELVSTSAMASVAGVAVDAGGFQSAENLSLQYEHIKLETARLKYGKEMGNIAEEQNNPRSPRSPRKEDEERWEIEI